MKQQQTDSYKIKPILRKNLGVPSDDSSIHGWQKKYSKNFTHVWFYDQVFASCDIYKTPVFVLIF